MGKHINQEQMSYYVDGECSAAEAEAIEKHLAECDSCRKEIECLRLLQKEIKALEILETTPQYEESFREKLEAETVTQGVFNAARNKAVCAAERIGAFLDTVVSDILLTHKRVLATASASIIVLLIMLNHFSVGSFPQIIAASGIASVYGADEDCKAARSNIAFVQGDKIHTQKGSYVDIEQKGIYKMRCKEDSIVIAKSVISSRKKGRIGFEVQKGAILVETDKGFKGSEMIIKTPEATAVVKGTGFLIEVSPVSGDTWLGVSHGAVAIKSNYQAEEVLVKAEHKVLISKNINKPEPVRMSSEELKKLTEINDIGRVVVSFVLSKNPDRVRELFGQLHFYIHGKYPLKLQKLAVKALSLSSEAQQEHNINKHMQTIAQLEQIVEEFPDRRNNPQIMLFMAAYLEKIGKHQDAIRMFERIVQEYPDSDKASIAQCAIGIIYEEKFKNTPDAVKAFKAVLAQYPESIEVKYSKNALERLL